MRSTNDAPQSKVAEPQCVAAGAAIFVGLLVLSLFRHRQAEPPGQIIARTLLAARMEEIGVIEAWPRKQAAQNRPFLQVVRAIVEIGTFSSQASSILAKPAPWHAKHCEVDVA